MDRKLIKLVIQEKQLLDAGRLRELDGLTLSSNTSLLDSLLAGGYVREEQLLPPLAEALGVTVLRADEFERLDAALTQALPEELRGHAGLLPVTQSNGRVVLGMTDPMDVELLDRVRTATGWQVDLRLASAATLAALRHKNAGGMPEAKAPSTVEGMAAATAGHDGSRSLEEQANEAPIVKLVNLAIMQAVSVGASDIHVEPFEKEAVVRYRVDGILRQVATYPKAQYPAIISRIKIMADLNISERRIPQDGRITFKVMDKLYDLRVASIPCLHGEGVVMRILDKESIRVDLEKLGFATDTLAGFMEQIHRSHGIVLVTGPTGCGKTTTLYAALSKINTIDTKIITVEDPCEYDLVGINQIQVNAAVGMTFAAGLRSILRLDPDIIMVGEIRDAETASIAIRSALTGHLVFSTLHTNDAVSAATRLIDMGVAPYLVSASVNAILAQRLLRRICKYCKHPVTPDETARALFTSVGMTCPPQLMAGKGCEECDGAGYAGRLGIHEVFVLNDEVRAAITANRSTDELWVLARKHGMRDMRTDGALKVAQGLTTAEEVIEATQDG